MQNLICQGDIVLDATCGNGNDTLFLADLVGDTGKVYAFDIQLVAINNTKEKLLNNLVAERVKLIHDTHESIDYYIDDQLDGAMFNLGYLPNTDTDLITLPNSTLSAIQKTLILLREGGLITIVFYTGHFGGLRELEVVETYLSSLDQNEWVVSHHKFINQINHPPQLITIQRIRR